MGPGICPSHGRGTGEQSIRCLVRVGTPYDSGPSEDATPVWNGSHCDVSNGVGTHAATATGADAAARRVKSGIPDRLWEFVAAPRAAGWHRHNPFSAIWGIAHGRMIRGNRDRNRLHEIRAETEIHYSAKNSRTKRYFLLITNSITCCVGIHRLWERRFAKYVGPRGSR